MSQSLTLFINLFAYSDTASTNNPQLRDFDYQRRLADIPTSKSRSQQHIVNIGESETVLSLQRALTTGASWTVSNPEGVTARYTWSGVNPVLRTERTGGSLVAGTTLDIVRLATSKVVRLTFGALPAAGIVAGDEIVLEDDSISVFNQGTYQVVAAAGNTVDVISENMTNETGLEIVDPDTIYAYSAGPVRLGDYLRIRNNLFNFGNRGEFQITRVTSRFIEVQNSDVVPEGPITADLVVYDQLYKMTYIEADQKVNIYLNGSTVPVEVEPIQEGEPGLVAVFLNRGPVFSVRIENVGFNAARCTTFFAT